MRVQDRLPGEQSHERPCHFDTERRQFHTRGPRERSTGPRRFLGRVVPALPGRGPTIEQIAASHSDSAKVGKLDVDANPVSASEYGITSLPSVLIFKAGEVDRIVASSRDRVTNKPCNRRAPDPGSAPMCRPRWSCDGDWHSGDSRPAHCVYKAMGLRVDFGRGAFR